MLKPTPSPEYTYAHLVQAARLGALQAIALVDKHKGKTEISYHAGVKEYGVRFERWVERGEVVLHRMNGNRRMYLLFDCEAKVAEESNWRREPVKTKVKK